MRKQSGHNTRPQARLPHRFLSMDAWMTSQLNVALFRKLRGSFICLAYFLTCYPRVFYRQALADHRSTAAAIKCMYRYCTIEMVPLSWNGVGVIAIQLESY